jgi:MmeI, target recognition domain
MRRTGIVPGDYHDPVAADWLDLLRIVEEKVKPEREKDNRDARRRYWWRFAERAPALYVAIAPLTRVLATSQTSTLRVFAFLPRRTIFSHKLIVFSLQRPDDFGILQSRPHEIWSNFFGSSMKDDPVYTVETCFDPFPFPDDGSFRDGLLETADQYYCFRGELMKEYNEGLTKLYNRFHDPDERSNAIGELRRLHNAMDRAVLDAYGWTDIRPTCEFELEWEDDGAENGRRRRKPWRYRWPEPIRDEVLARLLALNAQRAKEERLALGDR